PLLGRLMRQGLSEVIPAVGPGTHPATFSAIVGGRSYLNLSVARRHADLSPGVSAEDFDHQFAASGVDLPPYERPDEPGYEERGGRIEASITALLHEPPASEIEADRAA